MGSIPLIGFMLLIGVLLINPTRLDKNTSKDYSFSTDQGKILYFDTPTPDIVKKSEEKTPELISTNGQFAPQEDTQGNDILFSDDFSDVNWSENEWEIDKDIWEIINGSLCFVKNGKAFAGNNDWKDYAFSVDMMGVNSIDKILFFRYTDNLHSYYLFLRSYPLNDVVLAKTTPSFPDQVLIKQGFQNNFSTWYTVKVKVIGSHIQIFIDESLIIDYFDNDSPLLSGRIALMSMLPENGTVCYDNVIVESFD